MKATPKSCSCQHCQASKRSRNGKTELRLAERAFRRANKIALHLGREVLDAAPHHSPIG